MHGIVSTANWRLYRRWATNSWINARTNMSLARKLLLKARLVKSARLNITCHKQESSGLPCPLSEWFLRQTWNRAVKGAMSWMVQNEATQQITDKIVQDLYDVVWSRADTNKFRCPNQCMQQGWYISGITKKWSRRHFTHVLVVGKHAWFHPGSKFNGMEQLNGPTSQEFPGMPHAPSVTLG